MRIATYGRKSIYSDKSDSVDNQQRMCREYADFKFSGRIDSFDCYADEGFTGANTNRPDLQRLLDDIKCRRLDALIVYQLDRLSRDVRDFSNIYAVLEEAGIMFISIKENIDTATPIGKAMMYVTMVFAQMERETIAARVTDNMEGLARKGLWAGGNPPFGYRRKHIELNGKQHCTIEPVPDAADFVKDLFTEFVDGRHSLQSMETALKHKGVKTPNGSFFSTTQLHKTLTMPYCVPAVPEVWDHYQALGCQMADERDDWDGSVGVMIYGRTSYKRKRHELQPCDQWIVCKGVHEPFLPAELWLQVQKRMKQNTFDKKKKYPTPLLKGVLRCAKCGRLLQVSRKHYSRSMSSYYYCLNRSRQGQCDLSQINCRILDEKVLQVFSQIEADQDVIEQYAGDDQGRDYDAEIKEKESRAASIRNRIERLTESLADGSGAAKYLLKKIEAEDLSLQAITREIAALKAESRHADESCRSKKENAQRIVEMMHGLDGLSAEEKNQVVRDVVLECTWDGEELFLKL